MRTKNTVQNSAFLTNALKPSFPLRACVMTHIAQITARPAPAYKHVHLDAAPKPKNIPDSASHSRRSSVMNRYMNRYISRMKNTA